MGALGVLLIALLAPNRGLPWNTEVHFRGRRSLAWGSAFAPLLPVPAQRGGRKKEPRAASLHWRMRPPERGGTRKRKTRRQECASAEQQRSDGTQGCLRRARSLNLESPKNGERSGACARPGGSPLGSGLCALLMPCRRGVKAGGWGPSRLLPVCVPRVTPPTWAAPPSARPQVLVVAGLEPLYFRVSARTKRRGTPPEQA